MINPRLQSFSWILRIGFVFGTFIVTYLFWLSILFLLGIERVPGIYGSFLRHVPAYVAANLFFYWWNQLPLNQPDRERESEETGIPSNE